MNDGLYVLPMTKVIRYLGREDCVVTAPHKLTLDDLWALKNMGDVALSPDGRRVAFVMHSSDKEKNESSSAIFLLHLDEQGHATEQPRQLTSGAKNDTNPVWASDSHRLLFLSDREGTSQLWLIDTDGGEAIKLTNMLHGVSEAAWSPDGKWIAFIAPVALNDEDDVLTGRKPLDEVTKKQRDEENRIRLRTVTTIWYREDGRGLFETFNHVFLMPAPAVEENNMKFATIHRLTTGDVEHTQVSWTPDSIEIGVLCNRNDNRNRSLASDLWAIDRETGAAHCLTDGTLEIGCYSWSPDGQSAIIVGAKELTQFGSDIERLYLVTRRGNEGDKTLVLTPDVDKAVAPVVRSSFGTPGPYRPVWSADGQHIFFLVVEHGCSHVYRLSVVWRTLTQVTSNESITAFLALLPDEHALLLVQEQAEHPWELYRLPLTEAGVGEQEQLTHIYDQHMSELLLGKTERISYKGANGDEIDGWLIHPAGAREGVRYPLIVHIHGGPQWSYGIGLDPTYQYQAAQGYAVFYCNPHGSTGYGEAFLSHVIGDWGGWDYQDIMLGVDACIARGIADSERMVVTGYSYGGYMSMFIIGQTNRFKAAVPMAGISNLVGFVGTSDIGFWQVAQSQGYPWDLEHAEYYRARSPLTYAPRITTPTLLLHPENDLRCPIEQSEQLYMALKMIGKAPVEFVRVPGAWHGGTSKPSQQLAYYDKALAWFGKYVEIRPEEYS